LNSLRLSVEHCGAYHSPSQIVRCATEEWVHQEAYCPSRGDSLSKFENSRPVADFYCGKCTEQFELKSKRGGLASLVVDGAYRTMIERISGDENPSLFFLSYENASLNVRNLFVTPKHFFVPSIIQKRKRLSDSARRAGWIGCNILLSRIPESGKIFVIKEKSVQPKLRVLEKWSKTLFLREEKKPQEKGWILDIMRCLDRLGTREFSLSDVYSFEGELRRLHSSNRHIKDKIRQQLQALRDRDYLEFVGRGKYLLK